MSMANIIYTGQVPVQATPGSAGHDLFAALGAWLAPGESAAIGAGLKTAMPKGVVALLFIRSGLANKHGLCLKNSVAVIDSDFRGEWILLVRNDGKEPYNIAPGDRIAQAVFIEHLQPFFIKGNLEESVRGEGGLGSTGT